MQWILTRINYLIVDNAKAIFSAKKEIDKNLYIKNKKK